MAGRQTRPEKEKLAETVHDPGLAQIVRGHFQLHAVAIEQADETLAHLAGDVSQHCVLVGQFHVKHRPGQYVRYPSFNFDRFVLLHRNTPHDGWTHSATQNDLLGRQNNGQMGVVA
jgi:hypothetical protein